MPDKKTKTKKESNKSMKNPKTTSVLVGLGLALSLAYGYAQGNQGHQWTNNSINTFINNTGQAVGGLHIEYNTSGFLMVSQKPGQYVCKRTMGLQWPGQSELR